MGKYIAKNTIVAKRCIAIAWYLYLGKTLSQNNGIPMIHPIEANIK
jgi:hypothetical protein